MQKSDNIIATLILSSTVDGAASRVTMRYINTQFNTNSVTTYSETVAKELDNFDAIYTNSQTMIDFRLKDFEPSGHYTNQIIILEDTAMSLNIEDLKKLMAEFKHVHILATDGRHVASEIMGFYDHAGEKCNLSLSVMNEFPERHLLDEIEGMFGIHTMAYVGFSSSYAGYLLSRGMVDTVKFVVYPIILGCAYAEHPVIGLTSFLARSNETLIALDHVNTSITKNGITIMEYNIHQGERPVVEDDSSEFRPPQIVE